MTWRAAFAGLLLALAGCTAPTARLPSSVAPAAIEVQILAFNDFHGNLETPAPVEMAVSDGSKRRILTGGAAQLAGALEALRAGQANSVTVSAGDTIGATPLISAYFLDEPTIEVMNGFGVEYNAVGNHEFDRGVDELKRMQNGGCAKFTRRVPCAVEPFAGARFQYLAANVLGPDGNSVFPATAIKVFGSGASAVRIGFIGMTLENTRHLVTPSGVKGLTFADEAETANALVPKLKAQGADAIVLLLHQGGKLPQFTSGNSCEGLSGGILPILDRLDPAIATIVSGHTHWAYVCKQKFGGAERLLTSAGKNGYFVSDLRLKFDPADRRLIAQNATNVIVGTSVQNPRVRELVELYAAAAKPVGERVIGTLSAAAARDENDGESPAANLIADATLDATRAADKGGAQIALVNATGVRVGLPAGPVRYSQAFSMMPFGNNLVVMTLTGAQLKAALEQEFGAENIAAAKRVAVLAPSAGFTYQVDLARAGGDRIVAMSLTGKPIDPATNYRVAVNNYVASGGDGLTVFTGGTDVTDKGIVDIDALVAWIAPGRTPPLPDRVNLTRR
ncbi:MAG: bifunctional metallophosphatase/5'-nucleotidase [Sphingomicrobium sp.]